MAAPDTLSLRVYGASPGSHAHDHHQVLVALSGRLDVEVAGRGNRLAAGVGLLIPAGERHDFEAPAGRSECLVLDSSHASWLHCRAAAARPQQVSALAAFLARSLQADAPLARAHGPSLLLEAWGPVLAAPRPRRRIDWDALAAWVQANLHEPLPLSALASRVHLGASQLALRCHEAHGCAPQEWVRRQRLDKARQLRALGTPVAEAARRTGYRSPSALTAALRRANG